MSVRYENTAADCDEDSDPFLYEPFSEVLTFTGTSTTMAGPCFGPTPWSTATPSPIPTA